MDKFTYIDWDVKTITAGDYTIEFNISKEFYKKFKKKYEVEKMHDSSSQSWAEFFVKWITKEMETRLTASTDMGFFCESEQRKIEVAYSTLAFDNRKIIHLLRKRGNHIKNEDWENMHKVNQQFTKEMNQNHEEYSRPCTVFMCFKDEEGVKRALNYSFDFM